MARPERFELPTTWFEARYSIQLSYGRISRRILPGIRHRFPNAEEVSAHDFAYVFVAVAARD